MASSADEKKSRYVAGGTSEVFSNRIGWWDRTVMPFQNDDIIFTVDQEYAGRPDKISDIVYGTTKYNWVVLLYNTILDLDTELCAGCVIRLPTPTRLL